MSGDEETQAAAEARFTVAIPPSLAAWVDQECARRQVSRRALIRAALVELRTRGESSASPAPTKSKRGRQQRFLAAVEEHFGTGLAARHAAVDFGEVRGWLEDEGFRQAVDDAQALYVERFQSDLVATARAERKGVVAGYKAFLEAHSPYFGRLRIEYLSRFIGSLIEDWYDIVREMAGEKLGEAIVKRLREDAELRLARYSD